MATSLEKQLAQLQAEVAKTAMWKRQHQDRLAGILVRSHGVVEVAAAAGGAEVPRMGVGQPVGVLP